MSDPLEILQSSLTYDDEKVLKNELERMDLSTLQDCMARDSSFFIQACARGFQAAALYIYNTCSVDLQAKFQERTALQWACLRGHVGMVEQLLPLYKEMPLQTPAWEETSEFYSAALGGHLEIADILISNYSKLVVDPAIRHTLVYAACLGGHLPMVRRWLLPSMNVNQPVHFVQSLQDCEHRTPLHAACQGRHVEVAKLLMEEFHAEMTEHLASQFPDVTASLVDSVYSPLNMEEPEVKYNLSKADTHTVHPVWIKPYLSIIVHVNLSHNKLKHLDTCIPWALPHLEYLDISYNRILKIEAPSNAADIVCERLEQVNASHNRIEDVCVNIFQLPSLVLLNLSHNSLKRLSTTQSAISSTELPDKTFWDCPCLATLNLSHNCLDLVPSNMSSCKALTHLDLSHNKLCSLCSAWNCKLEYLDVSHNELERFPPSAEQFWSGSLTRLFVNNNQLDQLDENILKLGMVEKLNASYNQLRHLSPPDVWDCPSLVELNLSHNCLGEGQKADRKRPGGFPGLQFPSKLLSQELRSLNLSNNGLIELPISVCYIKNLALLDISNNLMQDLPQELGNLQECWELKLQGLRMQKADLQEAVRNGRPVEVIQHLRKKLRKVQPCHIMKVIVTGPQNKGKSTVIQALVRGSVTEVKQSSQHVAVTTTTLKAPSRIKIKERADGDRPEMTLRIWEVAGSPELQAMHPVFWSENSLFLLVWDMTEGVTGLSHWLCNIRSRLQRVGVIIVATFKDRIASSEVDRRVDEFHARINAMYGDLDENICVYPKEDGQKIFPHLCSVVFVTRQMQRSDVAELRNVVYFSAIKMIKIVRPPEFIVGQLLPQSYMAMDKKLMELSKQLKESNRPPFLTQEEFDDLIESMPSADFDIFDDRQDALEMWRQTGSMLHYDVWSEGLEKLYFLDPSWLAAMIATVLTPPNVSVAYRQPVSDIHLQLSASAYPSNIFNQFLQLLKHFDIGAVITDQNHLLLPCLLPKSAPGLDFSRSPYGRSLLRFYAMPHVPSRLWSRLILQLLMSMERFCQSCWQGVDMKRPRMTYWQEGLTIEFSGGSIVVESAVFIASEEQRKYPGILISIFTNSPCLADLAVTGFVTDEIDSTLQNVFPHYNDNTELFGIYALCPVCFQNVKPCEGIIRGGKLHFALALCAGRLLHGDFAHCSRGNKVALEDLIPEFLLGELPDKFRVDSEEVELKEKLGGGAVGTVFKGILRGGEVAVKVFYRNPFTPSVASEDRLSDSGTSTMSSSASAISITEPPVHPDFESEQIVYGNFEEMSEEVLLRRQDSLDGRNLKICRAFSELRQEVVILSQLQHPCLVSLLGVSVRPSLLVLLELAAMGSLRSVLNDNMKDRSFNKYRDKGKTFSAVFPKDITFKMVYQIALGLEYLHGQKIVYRDLKSDNILVCSLDPNDTINVKISDYGISKFTTSQGMTGMVGTPGYMAPEIMDGQAYNEKVDIFSFSMVVYEILTGHPPFEKCGRLHQIHQIVNTEKQRPSLMEYNVLPNFPYLETMMEKMWAHDPLDRPSATSIVCQMQDVGVLLQHSYLVPRKDSAGSSSNSSDSNSTDSDLFRNVTCVFAVTETNRATTAHGRNNCWVWESPSGREEDRCLSIYNLASGKPPTPVVKTSYGPQVTCMANVSQKLWIGVQDGSVDIFSCTYADNNKGKVQLDKLSADPVAIIHDKDNPNKEKFNVGSEGFVYVGLSNGVIQIYGYRPRGSMLLSRSRNVPSTDWISCKKLTLCTVLRLHAMCLVPSQRQLLAACGHSIVFVSTDTLLVERRICLLKVIPPDMREMVSTVNIVVRNEDTVWCSFLQSPLIIEFDVASWRVSAAYCIEADLEVNIWEVKLTGVVRNDGVCQSCGGMSSFDSGAGLSQAQGEVRRSRNSGGSKETSVPSPPPRPPKFTKPGTPHCEGSLVTVSNSEDVSEVQIRHKPAPAASGSLERNQLNSGLYNSITTQNAGQSDVEKPGKSHEVKNIGMESAVNKHSRSASVTDSSCPDEVFTPPPPLPPRLSMSNRHTGSTDQLLLSQELLPATSDVRNLEKCQGKSQTLPVQSSQCRLSPPKPLSPPPVPRRSHAMSHSESNKSNLNSANSLRGASAPSPRRPAPPPPPLQTRRSLPSEYDGVYVQSLLSVENTLWVGTSCGEILVIGVHRRNSDSQEPNAQETESQARVPSTHLNARSQVRRSLKLESKQMCNLKSVRMKKDEEMENMEQQKSGGVQALVRARNLVVAVRSVSQGQEAHDAAEIAVWDACSAEKITSTRIFWQSVAGLVGQ